MTIWEGLRNNCLRVFFVHANFEQWCYNEYKMSPTSISGGDKLLTGGELISPASLKHQEEDLSSTNLEQRCYNIAV